MGGGGRGSADDGLNVSSEYHCEDTAVFRNHFSSNC